jgi:hypothetical protein
MIRRRVSFFVFSFGPLCDRNSYSDLEICAIQSQNAVPVFIRNVVIVYLRPINRATSAVQAARAIFILTQKFSCASGVGKRSVAGPSNSSGLNITR